MKNVDTALETGILEAARKRSLFDTLFPAAPPLTAPIPSFGAAPTTVARIPASPDADVATAETVATMITLIRQSLPTPELRQAASDAYAGLRAGGDRRSRAQAAFWWVKSRVQFEPDSEVIRRALGRFDGQEGLIRPDRLISMPRPAGDCDDFSMLVCALLLAGGVPCELVTVAADPHRPREYSHVYAQAILEDGGRLPLDASHGSQPGWATRSYYRRQVWPIFPKSTLHGLDRAYGTPYWTDHGVKLGGGLGVDWGSPLDWFKTGAEFTKDILTLRPPGGTTISRTPEGTQVYRTAPYGLGPVQFMPDFPQFGTSSTTLLLVLGAVVVAAMLAKR